MKFGQVELADRFLPRRDALGVAGTAAAPELDWVGTAIHSLSGTTG